MSEIVTASQIKEQKLSGLYKVVVLDPDDIRFIDYSTNFMLNHTDLISEHERKKVTHAGTVSIINGEIREIVNCESFTLKIAWNQEFEDIVRKSLE